jgi:hypothetical protein
VGSPTGAGLDSEGYGGGIYFEGKSIIANNIIYGNSADYSGGIDAYNACPLLVNNTIFGNVATYEGGGIGFCYETHAVMLNTILWNNYAPMGSQVYIAGSEYPSFVKVSHSDVEGGQQGFYLMPGCTLEWGHGMIDADPLFANPSSGDFHLASIDSPCIDAGKNTSIVFWLGQDFEGDPRILLGKDKGGSSTTPGGKVYSKPYCTVDMGADEKKP